MAGNLLFRAVSFSHLDQFIMAKNAWNLAQRNTLVNIVFLRIGSSHELDNRLDYIHSCLRRRWIGSWKRASPYFSTLCRVTELKLAGAVLPIGFGLGISELLQLRHLTIERCCCEGRGGFINTKLRLRTLHIDVMCWHQENEDLELICSCPELQSLSITCHETICHAWDLTGKVLPTTVVELELSAPHSFWTNDRSTDAHTIATVFIILQRFTNVKILTIPRGMGCMPRNFGKERFFGRNIECYSGPACFIPYIASKTALLTKIQLVTHCFYSMHLDANLPRDLVVEDFHVNLTPWDTAYVQMMMQRLSSVKRLSLKWDWLPTNTAILYEVVIDNCMHLRNLLHLTLSPLTSINEQYLTRIRENCPTITSVTVDDERWIYTDRWHLVS
ncbi:hypothetical protein F5877DRAFT_83236 [Lentinula edodes]|nr:hypothetical protein F5877DRAFT_83236 [Lentinula edodes]